MYCKNCGNAVDSNAAICVNCGTPIGHGTNYCGNCGSQAAPGANVCMSCGYAINNAPNGNVPYPSKSDVPYSTGALPGAKSKMAAGLLGIFLGSLGVHNFYLGYTKKAIAQLLMTILSCGFLGIVSEIWGLVEGIMILTGSITTDGDGNILGE